MSKSSMPKLIIAVLSITAFAAGLSEFIVIGLLSQVATEFGVTMPQVGLLVTAYALGITLGSPLLTALTLSYSARSLAVILMSLFSILSAGSAITSDFTILLMLRVVAGAIHGAYFSITSASLPTVTDSRQTPLAIALMFSGLTLSMVLGVPAGMVAAVHYGWQAPFVVIASVAAIGAVLLWFVLPATFGPAAAVTGRTSVFRFALNNPALIRPYCFTVLAFGGGFVFFSYAEPWLTDAAGLEPQTVVLIMGAVGLGSLVGNIVGGILPGKIGLPAALVTVVIIQVVGLLGIFYTVNSVNSALYLVLWSVGAFATAPMVQGWAITDAGKSDARISASLNVSAFNLGMSVSSFIATRQIAADGMLYLPLTAAFLVMLAIPFCLFHQRASTLR
ncbi:MFS transporter [Serratia marcescens]|uniref:MFS transporter n=1 Tax=Serratia marcescens TaxID=615 RepID=A0A5C7BF17_SERMA|nr:MFS transporter [Serratia marcescens]TXE21686.1 MFS transporter [Serratia marcescens]TXE57161.1 MFS transporter [Serratia marcescens]